MDSIPIGLVFFGTIVLVLVSIEAGYRVGRFARRRSEDEKESPASAVSGAVLGLLAFILAFTFGIVSNRYDMRRELVRSEANAIRTAFLRSDFLPEPDRALAASWIREYVDLRVIRDFSQLPRIRSESDRISRQLWDMAVANARKDMNSDVAALYVESLNELIEFHALRVIVGVQSRIPVAIWYFLFALVVLAMYTVGYQAAVAGSRRSGSSLILAMSFSVVILLIVVMDRPNSRILAISFKPMVDLQTYVEGSSAVSPRVAP